MYTYWSIRHYELTLPTPCVVYFVCRAIVFLRALAILRRRLQLPVIEAQEEHLWKFKHGLSFLRCKVAELVLNKIQNSLRNTNMGKTRLWRKVWLFNCFWSFASCAAAESAQNYLLNVWLLKGWTSQGSLHDWLAHLQDAFPQQLREDYYFSNKKINISTKTESILSIYGNSW